MCGRRLMKQKKSKFQSEVEQGLREADDPAVCRISHEAVRSKWQRQRAQILKRTNVTLHLAMLNEEFDLPEFERILESTSGEREVAAFLKRYPRALYWTFCPASGHDRYVFAEFPLGSEHKVDFVILNSYSGAWEVYFIELEPVDDNVFTKRRTPTASVSAAMRQIDDWREFVSTNLPYLRSELVRWAKNFDLLGYSTRKNPSNYSGDRLADSRSVILTHYVILAGRSCRMTEEQRNLLGSITKGHNLSIATYDRMLHLARYNYGND
jgi:hypothetical protein